MFNLDPGEELELLIETARSFAGDELAPGIREAESQRLLAPAVRASFAQIGLSGLEIPESLGGAGLGALARVLVNEELAVGDPGAALSLDPFGPALYALSELGGDSALTAFATPLLEDASSRALLAYGPELDLEQSSESISGIVPWLPADRVDLLVILDASGASVIREGFELEELRGAGLRAAGASELRLNKAPIVARYNGVEAAARALARSRLYVASLILGVLRQTAEFSRGYAQERVAFGKPIAHHQALAFLITDMQMAIDGTRLLLHEAAWHADRGLDFTALAAAVFVEAIEASRFVGPNGVQILGGHGFMQDYPVEKHMRESRALGLLLGGVDPAREQAGQSLCTLGAPVQLSQIEAR
ncbi:MAG: acyl-CoA dehydrogenase [bacterium]|nr:acyl-CoA dehydrogenase [bacterium]